MLAFQSRVLLVLALLMIFAAVWGVIQLTVLGSFTRTVQARVVLGSIAVGFYACAIVAVGLQWGFTRLAASLFDVDVNDVVASAGFTVDPFIEEFIKIAPLLIAGFWFRSKQQWGVTDFVLVGSAFGAGFGLFEAFARYGQFLSKFTTFPGGHVRPNSFFPPFIPNFSGVISSWIPAPVTSVDIIEPAPDVAPHVVWSALAGLGVGLFFKAKSPIKMIGLLLVVVVSVDHAAWNYRVAESLIDAGFYTTYGASLIKPFGGISTGIQPVFWVWPLVAVVVASLFDLTVLRRNRPSLGRLIQTQSTRGLRLKSYVSYALQKPIWTAPIVWRFILAQRSACYALDYDSDMLARALVEDADVVQQTNNRDAWRHATLRAVWHQRRQIRPIAPARVASTVLWLILLIPTVMYFIVGGNPQSDIQERFHELTPLRIAAGTLIVSMLWVGWQIRVWLRRLRQHRNDPTNTVTVTALHRLLIGASSLVLSLVTLNIYRTTDPFSPAKQPLTYNAHVLDAISSLYLVTAVLLLAATPVLFPPVRLVLGVESAKKLARDRFPSGGLRVDPTPLGPNVDLPTFETPEWVENTVEEAQQRVDEFGAYAIEANQRRVERDGFFWFAKPGRAFDAVFEDSAAAVAIIGMDGKLYHGDPDGYCGGNHSCITGVSTPQGGAITLGHTVLYDDSTLRPDIVSHEQQHVYQYEEHGTSGFLQRWVASSAVDFVLGGDGYIDTEHEREGYYVQDHYGSGVRPDPGLNVPDTYFPSTEPTQPNRKYDWSISGAETRDDRGIAGEISAKINEVIWL